jgi:hypothetical protein
MLLIAVVPAGVALVKKRPKAIVGVSTLKLRWLTTLIEPLMSTGEVMALASVFLTAQPKVPVVLPVAMLPVMVEGEPTTTVEPVLEARLSTVKVPVELRATASGEESAGEVLVRVPLSETLVLTRARGVLAGAVSDRV